MASPHLKMTDMAEGDEDKEVLFNDTKDQLDNAINAPETIAITGDHNLSTTEQYNNGFFHLTGTPGSGFFLYLISGSAKRLSVLNNSDSTCTVAYDDAGSPAGATVAITTTNAASLHGDGSNVYQV